MAFHGYWLNTSLYLVLVADLSAFELVLLGTVLEATVLIAEVPTGVMADTISRKWSIVVSHVLMGVGMTATGFVTTFPALLATQVVWGVGWTFSSGASVAWVTDEVDDPLRINRVLTVAARWSMYGAAAGMVVFGLIGWATDLGSALNVAGVSMLAIGGYVTARFTEHRFAPTREHRWRASVAIARRGFRLSRSDTEIPLILAVAGLVGLGAEAFDRLYPRQLIVIGFPAGAATIVWFSLLGLATLTVGAIALRLIEVRIDGLDVPRRTVAAACLVAAIGFATLAHAPTVVVGAAGVLVVNGIAWTLIRSVNAIWMNQRVTSDVRATLQSFLGQIESTGEIVGGLMLGALAHATSITVALTAAGVPVVIAAVLLMRGGDRRAGCQGTPPPQY